MQVGGKNDYEITPRDISEDGVFVPEVRDAILADLGGVVALAASGPFGTRSNTIFTIAIEAEPTK